MLVVVKVDEPPAGGFVLGQPIIDWLREPLPEDKEDQLITLGVIEPFTNAVKVSAIVAIAITHVGRPGDAP